MKKWQTICMMNKHRLIFIIFAFIVSCINQGENSLQNLEGEVTGITFDHVINKREGCRFSSIYIHIKLINNTLDEIDLDFTCFKSFCTSTLKVSNLKLIQNEKIIPLALFCKKKHTTILPKEKVQFKFRAMTVVEGQSLNNIIKHNKPLLYKDFLVLYTLKNKTIKIEQSKSFKIKFFLDDQLISINDTLMLNKIPLPPDFESIEGKKLLK